MDNDGKLSPEGETISRFDALPFKVRVRFEEVFSKPSPIELRSDGTLNIDENVDISEQIDDISKLIPDPPDLSGIEIESILVRKDIRTAFEVETIRHVLGFTKDFIDNKLAKGDSYLEVKQDLTELGKDVEIILSAVARKFMIQQISEQQWGKYALRYGEVIKLESVASLRREINVRRANWELSKEYSVASKELKATKEEAFDNELRSVTDVLWKILHMGSNYLTPSERLNIKIATQNLSKKERQAYVDEELIGLRRSFLDKWRIQGSKFVMPRTKS